MKEIRFLKDRRRTGFTLAELLIVVAIIGVLAAVAVPVFAGTLEKSRETVCLHNQTVLQRHLIYDNISVDPKTIKEASLSAALQSYIISDRAECPGGGVYAVSYMNEIISVHCSLHGLAGLTNQSKAQVSIDDFLKSYKGKSDQKSILKAYHEYIKEENGGKPYTVSQEEILSFFPETAGSKPPSFNDVGSGEDLIWTTVRLYWGGSAHDVLMVTSESIAKHATSNPCNGYLVCYDGTYYRTTAMNYNKTAYHASYLTMTDGDAGKYPDLDAVMEQKGWVKIDK